MRFYRTKPMPMINVSFLATGLYGFGWQNKNVPKIWPTFMYLGKKIFSGKQLIIKEYLGIVCSNMLKTAGMD